MKVVTAAEMQDIGRRTIKEFGIPSAVLMERAGLAVAARVKVLFDHGKVVVLAGGGNNGGDGLVAARELFVQGWNVRVLMLAKEDRLSPDCLSQYRVARKMGVPCEFRTAVTGRDLHAAVVIDAIMGTGLYTAVKPAVAKIIRFINTAGVPVLSVDIPSGISSDTGAVMGEAVRADHTVTFGLPKRGLLLHPGAACAGQVFVEDIGFPPALLRSDEIRVELIEGRGVAPLLPERPAASHKGDFGHVLLLAGSRGKTGAALLASRACLRAGAGLVTIGVPETLVDVFQARVTEEMVLPLPDDGDGMLSERAYGDIIDFVNRRADVLAIGPGLGSGHGITGLVHQLVLTATIPMVLDADGINAASREREILGRAKAPLVLTPHPGEMARLLSSGDRNEVEKDRISTAGDFAKETGVCLVLKGAPTIIGSTEGVVFINTTGNAGMATAGTGDVLTGIIAALIGQGAEPLNASLLGVHLHGLAGDAAAEEKGLHSLIAGDIIEYLPKALCILKDA